MEDLWRRFLPRFVRTGRERARRAREACGERLDVVATELHALAGEAALLGVGDIDRLAREGERAARKKIPDECAKALAAIEAVLATMDDRDAE
jgi:HPt (histidine-containing phosphotransfer) domain-containing protein